MLSLRKAIHMAEAVLSEKLSPMSGNFNSFNDGFCVPNALDCAANGTH